MSAVLAIVLFAATAVPPPVEVGTVAYATGWPDGVLAERLEETSGDPDGDGDPGVTLVPGEHIEFMSESTGLALDGVPVVVAYTAASDAAESGALSFELLRCEAGECSPLSTTSVERSPWGGGELDRMRAELAPTRMAAAAGSYLCLRVVNVGGQPMQIAFGSDRHPTSLWLPTGDTLAAPTPAAEPTPPAPQPADDRRDLLAGSIGVERPTLPLRFPGALGAAAAVLFASAVGAVLVIGGRPLRTRRRLVHPARR